MFSSNRGRAARHQPALWPNGAILDQSRIPKRKGFSQMKTMKVSVRRRVFGILALALVLFLGYAAFWEGTTPAHAAATAYYVDCSQSTNGAGTESSPWNNLTAVNTHGAFNPGDSILFKQGTSCSGMLTPQGSGTVSAPITLDSYTTGAPTSRPVINGGTNVAAIELSNQQYWNIQDLEVEGGNYRVILITANTANTTYSGFNLTNLVVHDTTQFTYGTWYTDAGGIIFDPCNTTTVLSNIDIKTYNSVIFNKAKRRVFRIGAYDKFCLIIRLGRLFFGYPNKSHACD